MVTIFLDQGFILGYYLVKKRCQGTAVAFQLGLKKSLKSINTPPPPPPNKKLSKHCFITFRVVVKAVISTMKNN
jgi:hypothetical protein